MIQECADMKLWGFHLIDFFSNLLNMLWIQSNLVLQILVLNWQPSYRSIYFFLSDHISLETVKKVKNMT